MLIGPKYLLSLCQLEDSGWIRLELGIVQVKSLAEDWIDQEITLMLEVKIEQLPSLTRTITCKGSVTIPLHGSTFVDFQPETSNEFR